MATTQFLPKWHETIGLWIKGLVHLGASPFVFCSHFFANVWALQGHLSMPKMMYMYRRITNGLKMS